MKQAGGPALAAGLPHSVFPTFAAAQSCRILPNTNRQCRTPSPQIQAENGRVLFDAAIRLQGEMILKKHNRFAGRALSLLCALCFLALLPAGLHAGGGNARRAGADRGRPQLCGGIAQRALGRVPARPRLPLGGRQSERGLHTAAGRRRGVFFLCPHGRRSRIHIGMCCLRRGRARIHPHKRLPRLPAGRSLHGRADAGGLRAGHGGLHRPDGGRLRDRRKRAHGALR